MTDFMDGDMFPDRPDVPDFWRLSEVVLRLDGEASEGESDPMKMTAAVIDLDAVLYMGEQRVALLSRALGISLTEDFYSLLVTMFVTSVVTGIEFEKAGGHR